MPIYYNVLQFLRGGVKPKYYNITIVFGLQIEGKVRKVLQKSTFFEILKKLFLKTEEFDKKCHSIVMILREKKLSWEGCPHFVAKYYSITNFEGGRGLEKAPKRKPSQKSIFSSSNQYYTKHFYQTPQF